jgi:hypothetical protein
MLINLQNVMTYLQYHWVCQLKLKIAVQKPALIEPQVVINCFFKSYL